MLERALGTLCLYETVALHVRRWPHISRNVPTITKVVWSARGQHVAVYGLSVVLVAAGLTAAATHLLVEGWERL